MFRSMMLATASLAAFVAGAQCLSAMSMKDAVVTAVHSNPEIGEAVANREGIEFELEQGRGLYRPRIDLQASAGGEIADNSNTRESGDTDHLFFRREASVVVRQLLFDGFGVDGEVEFQAARVDSASFRVRERSEFIALAVIREYLEILRVHRILGYARDNLKYHQYVAGNIAKGTSGGSLSVADHQQAQERVLAARARIVELEEELKASEATFIKLVGRPIGKAGNVIKISGRQHSSLTAALSTARSNHPSIRFAKADIDAAQAQVKVAESKFYPKLSLEGRGSVGEDIGGERGADNDLQGNVVMEWNIYNGGIDTANKQEQIRHVDEAFQKLSRITREVEEGVRLSWDRRQQQAKRLKVLLQELSATDQLRSSYTEQFKIGERSLLDLLDTQNTRFNLQTAIATSDAAVKFAEYRLLASTGSLLRTIGVAPVAQARPYARRDANSPETLPPDAYERTEPRPPKE